MNFTYAPTDRGPVFSAGNATVHIPTDSPRLSPLIPVLADFIGKANDTAAVVKPELLAGQLVRPAAPLLSASHRVIVAATANAKEVATTEANALIPPPGIADAAARFGAEVRATIRNASPGDQIAAIQRASVVELAAMLDAGGALSGLSPDALAMARERAMRLFHIARTGLAARNALEPSIDRIIATGTDEAATDVQADAAVANLQQRIDAVDLDESVLQNLVRFVAVALDIQPSQALDKIMAAG